MGEENKYETNNPNRDKHLQKKKNTEYTFLPIRQPLLTLLFQIAIMGYSWGELVYSCLEKGCPTKPYATMPKGIMGDGGSRL